MVLRILVAWCVLSGLAAWASPSQSTPTLMLLVVAGSLSGMLACSSARSSALLRAASAGELRISDDGTRFSWWGRAAPSLAVGATLGSVAAFALGATFVTITPSLLFLLFFSTSAVSSLCGLALSRRDLRLIWRRRETTMAAWVWLDTALPAGVFAAGFAVVLAQLRFPVGPVAVGDAARHAAGTVLLYGVLLGVPAAMKTARESRAGLVQATTSHLVKFSPVAFSGTVGLLTLIIVPQVVDAIDASTFAVAKGALGLGIGTVAAALGALRGAARSA
ncbi:MAG: hypothetical protein ACO3JL_10520 [Myxococcota bacterium]